ncbi:MAG: hypothetical protein Q9202_003279 [Teloschistes flavicans]
MNPPLPALGNGRSPLNDSQRDCRGAQYGTNLNYDSCLDAFRTFELGTYPSPIQVRKRNTGEGVFAIWLPYRLISGNGVCTIDIVRKGTADFDTTSGPELSRAMWKLINQCVRDEGGQGGVASNIGEHGTLGIILRSYNPSQVQCSRQADQRFGFDECHVLLDHIPADVAPLKTWGRLGDPDVDVGLPSMQASVAPQNCRFRVRAYSTDPTVRDQMTRFEAWQAAVALKGMCARLNKRGNYVEMGILPPGAGERGFRACFFAWYAVMLTPLLAAAVCKGRNKRLYMTIDDYLGGPEPHGGAVGEGRELGNRTQGVNGMGLTLGGDEGGEGEWEWLPDGDEPDDDERS